LDNGSRLVTEGFAVSVNPECTMVFDREVTAHDLEMYAKHNHGVLRGIDKVFGAWLDTETGKTYLDVVTVVDDRDKALDLARSHGEIAVFDLGSFEEIRISYRVDDSDPTPNDPSIPAEDLCTAVHPYGWVCTWKEGHNAPHVAGTGIDIAAVWEK
jgi:hypothetical protein